MENLYANISNGQFNRILIQFDPQNSGINLFKKYHAQRGNANLIDSLDSFCHSLGIDFNVDTITSEYPTPYFVFHEGNILNKTNGGYRFENLYLKTYSEAQKVIVKQFFEMLSLVNINKYITGYNINVL